MRTMMLAAGLAIAALGLCPTARADTPSTAPALAALPTLSACSAAISQAERAQNLPPGLLDAIARVETGRADAQGHIAAWPWTLNVEGQGSFYDSRQSALDSVTALRARGVRSIDVGCLQVNLLHHPDAFASLDEALDPAHNAAYAARFLNDLHTQLGGWPAAIAAYHSATPELGIPYQLKVEAAWHGGGGASGGIRWWPGANGPIQIAGRPQPHRLLASTQSPAPAPGPAPGPARLIGAAQAGRTLDAYRITPIRQATLRAGPTALITPIRLADRR